MQLLKLMFSILLAVIISLTSCESKSVEKKNDGANKSAADSASEITQKYASGLLNVSSNAPLKEMLCQGWQLEDDLETLSMSNDPMGMLPFRSFYLSADSTYVMNPRNSLEHGRWFYNEANKSFQLSENKGGSTTYTIESITPQELIVVNKSDGGNTKLKYVASGKRYRDAADNPFHFSNCNWRIAPKKLESDAAIKERLKAFVHFHILFYRDNIANAEKKISFYGFPTCIKWYAGGIFVIKEKEIAANWVSCFYNNEQAMKARLMMETIIGKKYQWPKSNISWVMKNLDVLEQMYQKL